MNLRRLLFGKPLRSDAEAEEQIGPAQGIPVLGLDALASASYGPEAALTMLLVAGAAASIYIVPVSAALIALLLIVYFSYRQTIAAYPNGGGSFTVARENLGANAGLIAAAALSVDLHPECSGRNLGRCRCHRLGYSGSAASYAAAVPRDAHAAHGRELKGNPDCGPRLHGADLFVRVVIAIGLRQDHHLGRSSYAC